MKKKSEENFKLLGNDFHLSQLKKWYDEESDYHNKFVGGRGSKYWTLYELFNYKYCISKYCFISTESRILSFGCAEGSDTELLFKQYNFKLFGLEASDELISAFKERYPNSQIKKANISGEIDYADNTFDYVFIFGVLHHVPNVSFVLSELKRVLKPGGRVIIREPITWMYEGLLRPTTLSPNERGIPPFFFKKEFSKLEMKIIFFSYAYYRILFGIIRRSKFLISLSWSNPLLFYYLDNILCRFPFVKHYYPEKFYNKFAPSSAYYVFEK